MKVKTLDHGRTILLHDGKPALVALSLRDSETAPGRQKASLVVPCDANGVPVNPKDDMSGVVGVLPMPFAEPIIGTEDPAPCPHCGKDVCTTPNGFTPEWRLESC